MRKTKVTEIDAAERKTVDTAGLQKMLGVGRKTAVDVGTAAGARIQVGRRVFWNLQKVETYLDSISGD